MANPACASSEAPPLPQADFSATFTSVVKRVATFVFTDRTRKRRSDTPGANRVGRIRSFARGRRACSLGPCRRWSERGRCRRRASVGRSDPGAWSVAFAPTRSALVGSIPTDGSRGCAEHRERGADVALPNGGGQVGFGRAPAPGRGGLAAGGRLTAPAGEQRPGLRLGRRDPQLGVLGAARTVHLVDRDPRT